MSQLHQQLKEKIAELEQIRRIHVHTSELQLRLHQEEDALAMMDKTLDKEQRDVETLGREGFQTMFRKFLGDREEKLEKEREEYLRASLRFNELYKSVELIRFELNLLLSKAQDYEKVRDQVETLILQREEELIRYDAVKSVEMKGIYSRTDKLNQSKAQVEEALIAGQQSLRFLQMLENYLHEAKHGHMRHQALDHAGDMANKARHHLIHFRNELKDVYNNLELNVNIEIQRLSDLERLGQHLGDLIADMILNQKINKFLVPVRDRLQDCELFLTKLSTEKDSIRLKLEELDKQRREIIIT